MVSFKRFVHILLIIAVLGGIFLVYNISESRPASVQTLSVLTAEREFLQTAPVREGQRPRVWLLGDAGDGVYRKIYDNLRRLCTELHLTVAGEGRFDADAAKPEDLVVFCGASVGSAADPAELEAFIAGGGRVLLAAGISEEDASLWPVFGVRQVAPGDDFHYLAFEKPLLPLQPEQVYYDGNSGSARLEVRGEAEVYIRLVGEDSPILYTYDWEKGRVCVINGTFLAQARCAGLFTGAVGALLPDFVYPVLGVKAVFLDDLPMLTPDDDALCGQMYGYSAEGFVRDVMWPAFQGTSLRSNTPYTSSILAVASSEDRFEPVHEAVFTSICKSALKFGGELVWAVDCPQDGRIVFNENFIDRFSNIFTNYTVQGLALETDGLSPEMLDVPGAEIRSVRGMLESRELRFSRQDGRTVFPAATVGNSMQDGNLFSICSVLGAYGMVSHVFNVREMITRQDEPAAWDRDKLQLGYFESEILSRAPWLEGRTLSQTEGDVKSYLELDYGWTRQANRLELDCSGAVQGQAFFFHTDSRIAGAEGLTYQEVGNGYYLLRVQQSHGVLTLEEAK